jgi:hypothetical protein
VVVIGEKKIPFSPKKSGNGWFMVGKIWKWLVSGWEFPWRRGLGLWLWVGFGPSKLSMLSTVFGVPNLHSLRVPQVTIV